MSKIDTHKMWCFKKIYKRCPFGTVKGIMEFIEIRNEMQH